MLRPGHIKGYAPQFYDKSRQMQTVYDAQDDEIRAGWKQIHALNDESRISTCSARGLDRFEAMLGIRSLKSMSDEDRRTQIKAMMNTDKHYTYRAVVLMLDDILRPASPEYKKTPIRMEESQTGLKVFIGLESKHQLDAVRELLEAVVPCNLMLDIIVMFNRHNHYYGRTHASMREKTHLQLKEEVLNG